MRLQVKEGVIQGAPLTCDNCPAFKACLFHQKRMGGFKGKGQRARYVGYRIITDAADLHRAKEDYIGCQQFVETIQFRMLHGKALRDSGKDGEIITIVAQEGDTIKRRTQVKVNSRGQVIQVQAEIIPALKEAGIEVNEADMSYPTGWKEVSYNVVIPRMDQTSVGSSYDQEILKRQLDADRLDADTSDEAWEAAQRRMDKEPDFVPVSGPVSEPVVKRGPGRPPKVRDAEG